MAPLVVKGKVLVGNSGGELGVRGWLTALDAATGRIVWRAYSTGPDSDVLIGDQFKPRHGQDKGKDLGVSTSPSGAWKIGGGNAWGWISYDPDANLIYYGTANPGPWNPEQRPGDNKWTAGIFARDPDTGQARWFYQWSPHDLHDYDGVNENVLLTLTVGGKPRQVLVHPDRNGYVYMLDRLTGEVLSAKPFVHITTSEGVDLRTGLLKYNPATEPKGRPFGAQHLSGVASAARTGSRPRGRRARACCISRTRICARTRRLTRRATLRVRRTWASIRKCTPGPAAIAASSPRGTRLRARRRGRSRKTFPVWSGALATAGDVVFYGTMDGWFKAVDARSGALLRQFKTGSGIIGQPVAYRAPGRQGNTSRSSRASADGAGAISLEQSRSARRHGSQGLRQRDARSAAAHDQGGHALAVFALP